MDFRSSARSCHEQVEGNVKELVNKMLETEVDVSGAKFSTMSVSPKCRQMGSSHLSRFDSHVILT